MSPLSSPSTTPSRTARRSPANPGAEAPRSHVRSRSPAPASPPRRPAALQSSTRKTTCTPCRRSQVRSSKPFAGSRGSRTSASTSMSAPCGGARPSGNSSWTRSSTGAPSKRADAARLALVEPADARLAGHLDERPRPRGRPRSATGCGRAHRAALPPPPADEREQSAAAPASRAGGGSSNAPATERHAAPAP